MEIKKCVNCAFFEVPHYCSRVYPDSLSVEPYKNKSQYIANPNLFCDDWKKRRKGKSFEKWFSKNFPECEVENFKYNMKRAWYRN